METQHDSFMDMPHAKVAEILRKIADGLESANVYEGSIEFNIDPACAGLAVSAAVRTEGGMLFIPDLKTRFVKTV